MLTERFEEAVSYAAEAHAGQRRKGTDIPYLQHLLGTAANALRYGANEDEAIAALLHDAAEDQGGAERLADIRARFGGTVADIVRGCSDTVERRKPPWAERKRKYLAHLADAPVSQLLVSACDKIDNARSIVGDLRVHGPGFWEIFNEKRPEKQVGYYRGLVKAFAKRREELDARGAGGVVDELRWLVDEIGRLSGVPE